jgi:glycine C-acetyltransferase
LHSNGLYKSEQVIVSKQAGEIELTTGEKVLNFCANNYLGLANNADLVETGKRALDRYGYGMASVRFICGTQEEHKQLEGKISSFLKMEDTILYSSCFDANTGLFETLLGPEDAIISDALNHASIIDGVRLCKAKRYRYENNNMAALEAELQKTSDARFKLIATDCVFSMDGIIANLSGICDLAEKYDAMVMVDDSHAVGFVGEHGRGTSEYCKVEGRVDIITGMLGDANLAQEMAARLLDKGVYVIGFSFPVVPQGHARIRTQMSAVHSERDIDHVVEAFAQTGREIGIIPKEIS